MTEELLRQIRELNKTPLSRVLEKLLLEPWEGSLFLLQAAQDVLEDPSLERGTETFRTLSGIMEYDLLAMSPKRAYRLMTKSAQTDYSEEEMLEQLPLQKNREEKLLYLLEAISANLEENGFNLTPSIPMIRD